MPTPDRTSKPRAAELSHRGGAARLRRIAPLAALAVAALALTATGAHRALSFDALVVHAGELRAFAADRPLAAAAAYGALYVAVIALSLPVGLIATLAGGFLFGVPLGAALTIAAATAGATLVFLVARSAVGDALTARARGPASRLADGFRKDAFGYLLFLRLTPAFPFVVVNLVPALLGVGLRTFVAATAIGITPATVAFTAVGAGLGGLVAEAGARRADCLARGGGDCAATLDPAAVVSWPILLALTGLGVAALVPILARRLKARSDPERAE
jgi:uncharacterized membrane protein YdjX (TVP38/TMEM64 family)